MAEIKQELGFDAAQALETLAKLNKAFDSFGSRIDSLAENMGKFNSRSRNTEVATNKLAAAFNSNMSKAVESSERLTTSVQLLSRIVFTQFVIRQLRILRTAFQDTAESAAEFQREIARTETIAGGQNFAEIATRVRSISDNLNIPLLETASGAYQSLSNNVGDFNDSLKLTESAAKFAKATNSTLAQSVDLLSAAINSYGLSVDDADRIAGGFFETIRLGRVSATELANQFGRVAPRAAELGISIEEVNAALATTSTTGLKSSEAVTLLNGVVTGLTKPTTEMSAALQQFGFSSAEAAVQTLGLPKLLQSLVNSTDGTSASLAKLFPNVRGIGGALALTGDHLKTFAQGIEDGRKAGAAFAESKFLQATATDAERVTSEINKLHNALTVDLGQGLLKAAADTSQFIGGADNVIATVKVMTPAVFAVSAALAGYAVSARAASTASALLATRLGPLGAAIAALGIASSAGRAIDSAFFGKQIEAFNEIERASKKSLDQFKKAESEKLAAADNANKERVRGALQTVAELNKTYLKDRDNLKAANAALVDNTKASVDDIIRARERMVDALARSSDEARKLSTESQFRVADLQTARNNRQFEQSISGLSESNQVFALTQRAAQQAQAASKSFIAAAKVGDDRALQRALAAFDVAQSTNERAADVAQTTKSIGLQHRVMQQMQSLEQQRIKNETRLQRLSQQRVAALDAERDKQQAVVDRTRAAGKLLIANLNLFDGDKLLPQDQLLERQANRQKALAELTQLSFSSKDFDAAQALGLADFVSRFQNELQRDPITLALNVDSETKRIQAQLTQSFDRFSIKLGFDVTALEQALGRTFKTPDEVSFGLDEARKRAAEIQQQFSESDAAKKATAEVQRQLSEIDKVIDKVDASLRADTGNVGDGFRAFVTDFRAVSAASQITEDDIQRLLEKLKSTQQAAQGFFGVGRRPFLLEDFAVIIKALPLLKELQSQRTKAVEVPPETLQELQRIKAVIDSIQPTPFTSAANAISSGAVMAERIAASFERAAVAAGRLGIQPSINASAPSRAETTVQQLGSTSTVNLGGITVNAAPGTNGDLLAKQIATELNRALRRGAVQLRV